MAEWGVGVFGAEAAAKHYFNTSAAGLGASQSARLAAMLPNPRFYDRNRNSNYLNSRVGVLTAACRWSIFPEQDPPRRGEPARPSPRNSRQKYFRRRPMPGGRIC